MKINFLACLILLSVIGILNSKIQQPEWVFDEFDRWCALYSKNYTSPTEKIYRLGVFYANLIYIHDTNSRQSSYKLAVNQFADLTPDEIIESYTGFNPSNITNKNVAQTKNISIPDAVDWRNNSAVTPVKNQESCGSCWAFSTTGALEGLYAISSGILLTLSEQQLVDCTASYGCQGCNGGNFFEAMSYTSTYGIMSEFNYTYRGYDGKCKYNKEEVIMANGGYIGVESGNADSLFEAVVQQPVSIAIDASNLGFYSSGIFNDPDCGTWLNHAVLVVGYNLGEGYWIVKNSWGYSWGEEGYIKMAITNDTIGECGMYIEPGYPTL